MRIFLQIAGTGVKGSALKQRGAGFPYQIDGQTRARRRGNDFGRDAFSRAGDGKPAAGVEIGLHDSPHQTAPVRNAFGKEYARSRQGVQ